MNVGNVLKDMGKYEESLVRLQKALEIKLKLLGSEHPLIADILISLGSAYGRKGDLENALIQFQKSLEIRTREFASEHPLVAESFNNVGVNQGTKHTAGGISEALAVPSNYTYSKVV